MSNNIELIYTNFSPTVWNADQHYYTIEEGMEHMVSQPNSTLPANDGQGTLNIELENTTLGEGLEEYMYWCWNDGSWRFGLKIKVDFQLFGVGGSPQWYIMYDQNLNSSDISWDERSGDEQSQPYTFPSEIGYKIVATPTSEHQSLSVNTVISPAS